LKNVKIRISKTIILPVVLYGCETWSLILKEEHRLRAFENRVLRRIFGPKRDEVTGWRRKPHNLVGMPQGKRQLGRPRCRWVDNIKIDLGEVRWGNVDWIGLAQNRDNWRAVSAVINLCVP
jgi:hypothetical protein